MKKLDLIIVTVVLLTALIALGINNHKAEMIHENSNILRAEITVKGELYKVVPLSGEEQEFIIETELGRNVIVCSEEGVFISEADCFDHICEQTGMINQPGDIIACLPHKVIIEIKGDMEGEVDGVSK